MGIRDELSDAFWQAFLRARGMAAKDIDAELERLNSRNEQAQQERAKLIELLSTVAPERVAELLRQSGFEAAEVERLMAELDAKAKQLAPEPKRPS